MIGLLFFLFVGLGMFAMFMAVGLGGRRITAPDSSAVSAVTQMIQLGGLSFGNSRRLLDDSEYRILRTNPSLHRLADKLWQERKQLAIEWVSVLMGDLKALLRFRRFLVRRGAPVTAAEELQILATFAFSMSLLFVLKLSIRIAGPFALVQTTRRAGSMVGRMSSNTANLLGRIPSAGWPEIERSWMSSAA